MKQWISSISAGCLLLGLVVEGSARADTALAINYNGAADACLENETLFFPNQPAVTGGFNLNGVTGAGSFNSTVLGYYSNPPNTPPWKGFVYSYTVDLSAMAPAGNHCVKLLIHFGTPESCIGPAVIGDPAKIQSATLASQGDITFVFNGGCLAPAQPSVGFTMISGTVFKTNWVTIIDDYTDAASGQTNELRVSVRAIVPDVPPNFPPWWLLAPPPFQYPILQGILYTNQYVPPTNRFGTLGPYDFRVQLYNAPSNGIPISQVLTQMVQVGSGGIFNLPLLFDAVSFGGQGSAPWVKLAVRPTVSNADFTPLDPPLPIAPAPQAFYAYSAGVVADLSPGQAVTSLNGLTDNVILQAGNEIILGTNGNTLTISTPPGVPSDRSIKTDFAQIQPGELLRRLQLLPISSWRYTNELSGVRHVGPMAQDFKALFGLGQDDTFISFVDEQGVALAAIQALSAQLKEKESEIMNLQQRLEKLERSSPIPSAIPAEKAYRPAAEPVPADH